MYFWKKKDPKADTKPKVIENTKKSLVLYGKNTSNDIKSLLSELHMLRREHSIKFHKKNDILPFEDATSLEFFSQKNDTSLIAFGSHQKKRPHNLVLARTFNHKMLDLVEFGIENYTPMTKSSKDMCVAGSKPCIIFQGPHFINNPILAQVKNLFLDYFRVDEVKRINVLGLDHAIIITSLDDKKLHFGHYAIKYGAANAAPVTSAATSNVVAIDIPQVSLVEIGPMMNMTLRRTRFPTDELKKEAYKIPKELRKSKHRNKNVSRTLLGDVEGRLHVEQQDIKQLVTRKYKAFKQENIDEMEQEEEHAKGVEQVRKRAREATFNREDDE